jgi:putrescine aminotransferase
MSAAGPEVDGPEAVRRASVLAGYRRHVNTGLARLGDLMAAPVIASAAGSWVYDLDGEAYLDCGGYSLFLLGHAPPGVVEPVAAQLRRLAVTGPLVLTAELPAAAAALAEICPPGLDYVYFTNSGAEAVETALKLARLGGKRRLVSTDGGFHGKTLGALSVTGRQGYRDPFQPLLPGVTFVPFGDAAAMAQAVTADCCVVVEPVQGEAGVRIPPEGYLAEVAEACRRSGAILVADEIQTGLGRLGGSLWGIDAERVVPDMLLAGKALGGGLVPVGAVVCSAEVFAPLNADPLLHTSTFGGNPLAATAARHTIAEVLRQDVPARARDLGQRLLRLVAETLTRECGHLLTDVRGRGLLIGIEFAAPHLAGEFVLEMLANRVVVASSANTPHVIRLTPSALLTEAEVATLAAALGAAAAALARDHPPAASTDRTDRLVQGSSWVQ